jgi:hypothetical protein
LSGEEFYRFTRSLQWGGGLEGERYCSGSNGCLGSTPLLHTTVRVDAVDGQDSLLATFGPTTGVVAARALNTGKYEEARYGFKPSGNFEYYAIVLPDDATKGRYIIEELDVTPARAVTERSAWERSSHATTRSRRAGRFGLRSIGATTRTTCRRP